MINNLSDLVAAFKAWWNAPIKLTRNPDEPMTPEEFKKLPPHIIDLFSNKSMQGYRDQYYAGLRHRLNAGDRLSPEEHYRLRMHDQINHINNGLDNPDKFWEDK